MLNRNFRMEEHVFRLVFFFEKQAFFADLGKITSTLFEMVQHWVEMHFSFQHDRNYRMY